MTDLYSHGYEEEISEDSWREMTVDAEVYDWMQRETMDTAAADEASGRRADEETARCDTCYQSLADIAESRFLCPGCFFSFEPDDLDEALKSTDDPKTAAPVERQYTMADITAALTAIQADVDDKFGDNDGETAKYMNEQNFTYAQRLVVDRVAEDMQRLLARRAF